MPYCYIMKVSNKRELQEIAKSHSSGIYFKDFVKCHRDHV